MKTFKAFKTGRIYEVEQVLYCSIEAVDDDVIGYMMNVIIVDPSRGLTYKYDNAWSLGIDASDMLSIYDSGKGIHASNEDLVELEKFFGLDEIKEAFISFFKDYGGGIWEGTIQLVSFAK